MILAKKTAIALINVNRSGSPETILRRIRQNGPMDLVTRREKDSRRVLAYRSDRKYVVVNLYK